MNIDELFHKYSMQVKTWDGVKIQVMYKEHFTEAIAEAISFPVEAEVRLRCLNCGKPLKEYLLEDIEDETLKLPFCDDQCMDFYKDVDPNYFG